MTRWLDDAQMRAWLGYRRMRLLLDLQVSRDLAEDSGLSDADYDVLSSLSETEGHQLRLSELSAHMRWSKSRLSHHLTRMQQRGLVTREECPSDGRGAVILLTDDGWRALRTAAPAHVESVRRHFIDRLTDEQIRVLGDIAEGVIGHLDDVPSRAPTGRAGNQPEQKAARGQPEQKAARGRPEERAARRRPAEK